MQRCVNSESIEVLIQAGEFERVQFPAGFITELVSARYGTLDRPFEESSVGQPHDSSCWHGGFSMKPRHPARGLESPPRLLPAGLG